MSSDDRSFLGRGWGFPPAFSRDDLGARMVAEEQDIQESLRILFGTGLGERVMLPHYGCRLGEFVFQPLTRSVIARLQSAVTRAILHWEPRISVLEVHVVADPEAPGRIEITVAYVVRRTNTRSNLVYPFSTVEATLAPGDP